MRPNKITPISSKRSINEVEDMRRQEYAREERRLVEERIVWRWRWGFAVGTLSGALAYWVLSLILSAVL